MNPSEQIYPSDSLHLPLEAHKKAVKSIGVYAEYNPTSRFLTYQVGETIIGGAALNLFPTKMFMTGTCVGRVQKKEVAQARNGKGSIFKPRGSYSYAALVQQLEGYEKANYLYYFTTIGTQVNVLNAGNQLAEWFRHPNVVLLSSVIHANEIPTLVREGRVTMEQLTELKIQHLLLSVSLGDGGDTTSGFYAVHSAEITNSELHRSFSEKRVHPNGLDYLLDPRAIHFLENNFGNIAQGDVDAIAMLAKSKQIKSEQHFKQMPDVILSSHAGAVFIHG